MSEDYSLKKLLEKFVNIYADIPDIQSDPKMDPKLWFMPPRTSSAKKEAAHYFLLAASLNEGKVIGDARNVRVLLWCLHKKLHERLFTTHEHSEFKDEVTRCQSTYYQFFGQFGPEKENIPDYLIRVNSFVSDKAGGDLIKYAENFEKPQDMVKKLAYSRGLWGGSHRGKSWLYMRWMVRDNPDLRLFKNSRGRHFCPRDLMVPLTTPTLRVTVALELVGGEVVEAFQSDEIGKWWKECHEEQKRARIALTDYAKTLFRDDPARVDHAFFVLGKWLNGFDLNKRVLIKFLEFFNKRYDEVGKPPIKYLAVYKDKYKYGTEIGASGSIETRFARMLYKKGIRFNYEPIVFNLSKIPSEPPTYKPDFILRERIGGKKVFFEPHGHSARALRAEDIKQEQYKHMKQEVNKWSLFREKYEEYCSLIVILPDDLVDIIHQIPDEQDAYDCLWRERETSKKLDRLLIED